VLVYFICGVELVLRLRLRLRLRLKLGTLVMHEYCIIIGLTVGLNH
jgi:hypothetical protein